MSMELNLDPGPCGGNGVSREGPWRKRSLCSFREYVLLSLPTPCSIELFMGNEKVRAWTLNINPVHIWHLHINSVHLSSLTDLFSLTSLAPSRAIKTFPWLLINAYRHGWGFQASKAHLSQSVCRLLFLALESMRVPGSHLHRRRANYHHGNLKRRWWWCPRLSLFSPARCRAQPQSAEASHFAKRQRLAEWHHGSPLHPLWVSRSLCCKYVR